MDRKERLDNRKKCITNGTCVSISGIIMLFIAAIINAFNIDVVAALFLNIESIILIIAGAVYPTIFIIYRNNWLKKNNLFL